MGIKCPKYQTNNPDTQKFCGAWGTVILSHHVIKHGLLRYRVHTMDYGLTYARRQWRYDELPIPNSHAVHFFNYCGKETAAPDSLYDRLRTRYLGGGAP